MQRIRQTQKAQNTLQGDTIQKLKTVDTQKATFRHGARHKGMRPPNAPVAF